MRWGLIVLLCVIGFLTGLANLYGLFQGFETWVSIAEWIVFGAILGAFARRKYFLHGFLTGIISGVLGSVLIYFSYDTYTANNAAIRQAMEKMPAGMDMRSMMLYTAPIGWGVAGVVAGLLALLGGKLLGEKPVEPKPDLSALTGTTPPPEEKSNTPS
jgi:uncharacterized membrane protein YeaQ/YmgE (transglycosylase-associated protein family)